MANRKKTFSLQEVISFCLESDNDESDIEISSSDSDDDVVEESSINLEQMLNNIDEDEPVLRNSVFVEQELSTSPDPSASSADDHTVDTVSKLPLNK